MKTSFFEKSFMKTKIKKDEVTLFPEAGLGYLLGPILALVSNGVVNVWLIQYWDKVLMLGQWAPLFETLLPILSAIVIIIGNLFVGKLMERKPTLAGKARPLILIGMPIIAVALLALFLVPLPEGATWFVGIKQFNGTTSNLIASIVIAVAYNLYYALAWPLYYTSHSALVNLSTRDEKKRGLLSTCIMAAQLGAAGLSGMAGGILVDFIGLLPTYKYTVLENGKLVEKVTTDLSVAQQAGAYTMGITPDQANSKWVILMIIMVVCLVIGCLLEYFFTRERITEEIVEKNQNAGNEEVKSISMGEQIKVCVKDKYWWLIIVFFFLYQFGGQMKNNDMSFYSIAMTGQSTLSSIINTVGAIPTALGMLIVWPLANRFTKSKTIVMGCMLAFLGGSLAFVALVPAIQANIGAVTGLSVASFCIKALGTAPAMYISLALLANVLDHQEAKYGIRTDGFTMAVYGSTMVCMAGVCNGIIVGINSIVPADIKPVVHTFLGFGVESIAYLVMGIMFIFMNVEKYTKEDKEKLKANKEIKNNN